MKNPANFIAPLIVILILLSTAFYTVDETEQAVVTQFGKFIKMVTKPGLHVKVPFVQQVTFFEDRILEYDAAPKEVISRDKKAIVMDNYAKWRISDAQKFYESLRDEVRAQFRIDDIIYSELRAELGVRDFSAIISAERSQIMEEVTQNSNKQASKYGIEIVDVRIKRADLPPENEKSIFGRMETERQREAKQYRSEGEREATKIRAEADKERTVILAEAYKKEQQIKGEGDAEAIKIYAEAFQQDPEFYGFTRTLDAYKRSLKDKTTIVLSPGSEFLKYLTRFDAEQK
jgi:membrane protease subunit HflC